LIHLLVDMHLRLEREKHLATMDPLLVATQKQIYALEDAIELEEELADARTEALGVLDKAYDDHVKGIVDAFDKLVDGEGGLKDQISGVTDSISILSGAVDSLTAAGDSMDKVTKSSLAAARQELKVITAKAKAGDYSGFEDMDAPLALLTADNSELYGSFQEFNLQQAQARAAIENLKSAAGEHLTTE
jgi:hypothetical protein